MAVKKRKWFLIVFSSIKYVLCAAESDQVLEGSEGQCILTMKKQDAPGVMLFYFLSHFKPRRTKNI